MRRSDGFTLIELLLVVALVAIVLAIAAPSFTNMVLNQRLRSINAQLVTDLQFARSEAAARNLRVRLKFLSDAQMSCYSIFTMPSAAHQSGNTCNCMASVGSACTTVGASELRTVQVPSSRSVYVKTPTASSNGFAFNPATGAIEVDADDSGTRPPGPFLVDTSIDVARRLRVTVSLSGRPTVCTPAGATMPEPACVP